MPESETLADSGEPPSEERDDLPAGEEIESKFGLNSLRDWGVAPTQRIGSMPFGLARVRVLF